MFMIKGHSALASQTAIYKPYIHEAQNPRRTYYCRRNSVVGVLRRGFVTKSFLIQKYGFHLAHGASVFLAD